MPAITCKRCGKLDAMTAPRAMTDGEIGRVLSSKADAEDWAYWRSARRASCGRCGKVTTVFTNMPVPEDPLSLADFLALVRDRCDASPEKPAGQVLRDELECLRPDIADAIKHIARYWDAPEDAPAGYFPEGVPFKAAGKWCYPAFSPDSDARLTGCSLQQAYMLGFDDGESGHRHVRLASEAST